MREAAAEMTKKFYRAKEAAVYLGVGVSTIWLWKKQGKIVAKKIGSNITVFDKEVLDKLYTEAK